MMLSCKLIVMDLDIRDLELLEALDQPPDADRRRQPPVRQPARAQPTAAPARTATRCPTVRTPWPPDRRQPGRHADAARRAELRYPNCATPCVTSRRSIPAPATPCASGPSAARTTNGCQTCCASSGASNPRPISPSRRCPTMPTSTHSSTARSTSRSSTNSTAQMDRVRLHELFDDELLAIVASDHPWAAQALRRADDFTNAHLVMFDSYDPAHTPAIAAADSGRRATRQAHAAPARHRARRRDRDRIGRSDRDAVMDRRAATSRAVESSVSRSAAKRTAAPGTRPPAAAPRPSRSGPSSTCCATCSAAATTCGHHQPLPQASGGVIGHPDPALSRWHCTQSLFTSPGPGRKPQHQYLLITVAVKPAGTSPSNPSESFSCRMTHNA